MDLFVQNLTKIYDNKKRALNNVSMEYHGKGIISIIGRNGAGKTTLVRIISTQLIPTSGKVTLDGIDVIREPSQVREFIAAVPQEARPIPWLTPKQTVSSYLMWRGYSYRESVQRGLEILRKFNLEEVENVKNRKLSGGQKRKLLVATVLASEANVIFLDEPTTGLDYISRKELWEFLKKEKQEKLIILTTHYLEEAESLGDYIFILGKGSILNHGTMEDLRKNFRLNYYIKTKDPDFDLPIEHEIVDLGNGEFMVLINDRYREDIIHRLVDLGKDFSAGSITLNTIFEYYARGEEEYDEE